MVEPGLFGELPESEAVAAAKAGGRPRMREPVRDQIALRPVDLESLLSADHPARVIWAYVISLDLGELEEAIKARTHTPGQAPASPRLYLALWLFATIEGIGSARALARLTESHDAYRWLCGGVSLNYHGLADFRTAHGALLDRLLTEHVAALSASGLVDLNEVAQDGLRVRAAAGAASYRRKKTLRKELKKAGRLVARLKRELEENPDASNARIRAARERAAREREARVAAALGKLGEIEAQREKANKRRTTGRRETATPEEMATQRETAEPEETAEPQETDKPREPRASTTDAEARVMKMADGGFRPAYNCQVATAAKGEIVVAVCAVANGSDRGLVRPMLDALGRRYGRRPKRHLVDGGYCKNDDTEWAAGEGVRLYGPAGQNKHKTDPYAARADDGPGVAAWRKRMKSAHGKGVYKRRALTECVHARFRQWGLQQFTVRGQEKATTILRWFALAHNILAAHRLRLAAA